MILTWCDHVVQPWTRAISNLMWAVFYCERGISTSLIKNTNTLRKIYLYLLINQHETVHTSCHTHSNTRVSIEDCNPEFHWTREDIRASMEPNEKLLSCFQFVLYKCHKCQHCIISNKHIGRLDMMAPALFFTFIMWLQK